VRAALPDPIRETTVVIDLELSFMDSAGISELVIACYGASTRAER